MLLSSNKITITGKTITYLYSTKIIYKFSLEMSVSTTKKKEFCVIQVMKDAGYVNKI